MPRFSLGSGFVWLLNGLLFSPVVLAGEAASPVRIPVVKTWKDLQSEQPIDLGEGVKIRLGLSADKSPLWSGAFLYCLTEGYTPATEGTGPEPFGPVHATFAFGKLKVVGEHIQWETAHKVLLKGSYLYVRNLPVDRVGTYQVQVTHPKGRVLAEAALEGTREPFHPWMPWFFLGVIHGLPESGCAAGIALPAWNRCGPAASVEKGKAPLDKLPPLIPTQPTPGFRIVFREGDVLIQAETEFTASRPEYHFLARWWVNDKPFVPGQLNDCPVMQGYGLWFTEKELWVPACFVPKYVGARAGDKIGLQLLYCPAGWNWCGATQLSAVGAGPAGPWLSNRIDFTAREAKAK